MNRQAMVWAVLISLLGVIAGATRADEPAQSQRSERYPGAAFLFELDQITVVYPAGPAATANRVSAERRASFLQRTHGVAAEISSDRELTDVQRQGNLLLLGWDNAVFDEQGIAAPYRRTPTGFSFLGLDETDLQADLLFYARSPFNEDSFLVFWSRIDPERDRFQVLPRVGSDWAIIDDFLTVRQGMFRPGGAWPPVRDTAAERDQRNDQNRLRARWSTHSTAHYTIYYDASQLDAARLREVGTAREQAYSRALSALGGAGNGAAERITLYVYNDAQHKRDATGVPDAAHSIPSRAEIHLLSAHARSPSPHEEIHVLAHRLLGSASLTTVYEGRSLAEEQVFRDQPLSFHAAMMFEQDVFPALADLLDEERARGLPPAARFAAAGLLMTWIGETFDAERQAAVYTLTDGRVEACAAAAGRPAAELETAFAAWLQQQVAGHADEIAALAFEREAQQALLVGDYPGVVAALTKVVELRPEDSQALFNLASAQMRTASYQEAEAVLLRLLALPRPGIASRFEIFGYYQLGRIYDLQGQREIALTHYRKVLALPDQHDSHQLAREAIATPFTVDQLD